jgi:hypothetical protein
MKPSGWVATLCYGQTKLLHYAQLRGRELAIRLAGHKSRLAVPVLCTAEAQLIRRFD